MADDEKVENAESSERENSPKSNGIVEPVTEATAVNVSKTSKKKKKKKGKKKDDSQPDGVPNPQALGQNIRKAMGMMKFTSDPSTSRGKGKGDVLEKKYEFWDTQPVPKLSKYIS